MFNSSLEHCGAKCNFNCFYPSRSPYSLCNLQVFVNNVQRKLLVCVEKLYILYFEKIIFNKKCRGNWKAVITFEGENKAGLHLINLHGWSIYNVL
jgi:hypothetical protein